jgi:hypothetical protein
MTAWTNPLEKSWIVNEMADAVDLNQYHTANQNATMHRYVRKTFETPRTGATALADNELWFNVRPGETFNVWGNIRWNNSAASEGLRITFSIPSGSNHNGEAWGRDLSMNLQHVQFNIVAGHFGSAVTGPGTSNMVYFVTTIASGPGLGRYVFGWAKSVDLGGGGTVSVLPGSCLLVQKMTP